MKINSIQLDEDELPEEITVTMSLAEMALIANYVGHLTPTTEASTDIWNALVGGVINRFWDDGINGLRRSQR